MAEQLKDGIIVSAFFGEDRSLVFETAVIVVFSNDLPPPFIVYQETDGKFTGLITILQAHLIYSEFLKRIMLKRN
jgi:hypothetical protein